jgi:rod shape-determining protein MreB
MLLDTLSGWFTLDLGIDLGTYTTLIGVSGKGIVLNEPSVVAVRKGTNIVVSNGEAVGLAAREMLGKTPGSISAIRPLKNGVISDFEITEVMLSYFIRKVRRGQGDQAEGSDRTRPDFVRLAHTPALGAGLNGISRKGWPSTKLDFVKPVRLRVAIAVPGGTTQVERQAVIETAERIGARKVYLIDEPMAAGIGAGLPIADPTASMIVDIGGGTTEVAIMSLGDIATTRSIRIGGNDIDEAIINHLKRTYNLVIGEARAEKVKIEIGSVIPLQEELTMEVAGRDITSGLPKKIVVTSKEVRQAVRGPIAAIIDVITATLEKTEPELAADLIDNGIHICGGGALLRGMDTLLADATGLKVQIAQDPLSCVALGTCMYLENMQLRKDAMAVTSMNGVPGPSGS